MGGRQVRTGLDHGEIFDHHIVEFTYADGSLMFSQCRHIPGCWNSVSEHCSGPGGYSEIGSGVVMDWDGNEIFRSSGPRGGYVQEHRDLFDAIRNGEAPNEGDYGAHSTLTAILGRMATYSGQVVTWEQALNFAAPLADVDSLQSLDDPAPLSPDENGRYPIAVPGRTLVEELKD